MWCTRWFLPLFLLPLPTAPPFFLVLLLFSLTIHAKPCFYCIVLLATLFVSSCYWQPFPLDTPLSHPWADNITTFGEALNASLTQSYWESPHAKPLPSVLHPVDRCWCDFATGNFFDPFNTSNWEINSVKRVKEQLEKQLTHDEELAALEHEPQPMKNDEQSQTDTDMPKTASPAFPTSTLAWARNSTAAIPRLGFASIRPNLWKLVQSLRRPGSDSPGPTPETIPPPQQQNGKPLPLIRNEYDLRPFGIGMFIDFKWTS
ncbi:hypothetical protein V5O48_000667 [Marasmius crinis-equi]|uniref:Uncharacterized protein n=1 Tax=Marasmius crinis-equi TaxID=585013 RepID=A0ABR3G0T3_9AGAR